MLGGVEVSAVSAVLGIIQIFEEKLFCIKDVLCVITLHLNIGLEQFSETVR